MNKFCKATGNVDANKEALNNYSGLLLSEKYKVIF